MRDIYRFPGLVYLFCCSQIWDRSWEYINRSQTHERRNWDWYRAVLFLEIHKLYFRYSVEYSFIVGGNPERYYAVMGNCYGLIGRPRYPDEPLFKRTTSGQCEEIFVTCYRIWGRPRWGGAWVVTACRQMSLPGLLLRPAARCLCLVCCHGLPQDVSACSVVAHLHKLARAKCTPPPQCSSQ